MKPFHTSVVIGRFQIPHRGHKLLLEKAAEVADHLVIIVGSANSPKTPRNPFSFEQRKEMLKHIIPPNIKGCDILAVQDQKYNMNSWVVDVVNKVNSAADHSDKIALVGHKKDDSSFYLDLFPQWKYINMSQEIILDATTIRENLYKFPSTSVGEDVPEQIRNFLNEWKFTDDFRRIQEEWFFIRNYKRPYINLPFPPIFVTVDAVVIQSGHVLMIKRKAPPGKGLWALPGGFIGENEFLRDAVLRELVEETQIKLQEIILDRSITKQKVYDYPDRSSRGRTITHAFLFDLKPGELPRIRGASDADKAKWLPLNEVYAMRELIYEDHLDIILDMVH